MAKRLRSSPTSVSSHLIYKLVYYIRDLGIEFNSKVKFYSDVENIVLRAYRLLTFLYRITKPFKTFIN